MTRPDAKPEVQHLVARALGSITVLITPDGGGTPDDSRYEVLALLKSLERDPQWALWVTLTAALEILGDIEEHKPGGRYDGDGAEALRELATWIDANRKVSA